MNLHRYKVLIHEPFFLDYIHACFIVVEESSMAMQSVIALRRFFEAENENSPEFEQMFTVIAANVEARKTKNSFELFSRNSDNIRMILVLYSV